jgi:hypothetical protein
MRGRPVPYGHEGHVPWASSPLPQVARSEFRERILDYWNTAGGGSTHMRMAERPHGHANDGCHVRDLANTEDEVG